jgi:branched-chain amino acid transport system ATP-binding protein/branched-chain amino acid transport system permease protein
MTVLDSVAVARWRDRDLARARGHAMALLDQLGLGDVAMRPCGGLPQGLKRRVEIARALALAPRLLLLDEPAAGLNPSEQRELAGRLRQLAQGGLSLLVIEHNMPFLMPLVGRMVCLDHGQVIATGAPAEIRRDARVIEAYLGVESEGARASGCRDGGQTA